MKMLIESARWRRLQSTEATASQYASASASRDRLAENIGFAAVVVAELELGEIQREILLADVVVSADDSAFKQRPEAFDVIGMHFAAHIFVRFVINRIVRESLTKFLVVRAFVRCDQIDSDTASLTNRLIVSIEVSWMIWQVTLPLREIAPMTAILWIGPRPLCFLSQWRLRLSPPM
jgi:hypothetical protein